MTIEGYISFTNKGDNYIGLVDSSTDDTICLKELKKQGINLDEKNLSEAKTIVDNIFEKPGGKPKTKNQKPKTKNQKPKTKNQKPKKSRKTKRRRSSQ
jgi:hypothetical protein